MSRSTGRWIVSLAALCAVAVLASFFFMHKSPPPTLDLARSKATENSLYQIAIAPEVEPLKQGELHSWLVTVRTSDGKSVEGAKILIDGGMPDHGHGLPTSPQATAYLGEGRYRVEGVKFNMSGWWQLKFEVSASPGTDHATFNLAL